MAKTAGASSSNSVYYSASYSLAPPPSTEDERARLVYAPPAYPSTATTTTTTTYSTVNGGYYAVPQPKPTVRRLGGARPKSAGKKFYLAILALCVTVGPLLMYFLVPRYPLFTATSNSDPVDIGNFTYQIDYYWDVFNWNYVPAYIEEFDYSTESNGLVLWSGYDNRIVELPSRTTTQIVTSTEFGGDEVLRQIRARCNAGERVEFVTNISFRVKVIASTLVVRYGPTYYVYC